MAEITAEASFQLRFCPSLAKKPTPQNDKQAFKSSGISIDFSKTQSKPKHNPFADPEPALFITDIPVKNPSHFLVLNKFPIISEHFILATKEEKEQSAWLEKDDIAVTYAVLCEWERTSEESGTNKLFAFFNCGNESGASQSHRHIQFLPNASMQNGLDTIDSSKARWENLTNIVAEQGPKGTLPELPFAYFGNNIPPEADEDDFYQVYVSLIEKAGQAIRDTKVVWTQHGTPYSYNLAMTTSAMILCPRRHESKPVLTADGLPPRGSEGDLANWNVALNGTILAGTLMVKDKELFEYFKGDKDGAIDRVLSGVCFPFEYAKKVQKASESDTTKL